ncbi:hypothetical protein [Paenibacillus segetis]|uniref:AAA domain-containing protein n=1 Tax=Paenibacillus segetis TaxID=1325360 RepID=A0ABQ1Y5F0_9BACL|nr:hypothetical protein [Paenibacillus segetis]GGH13195.1 hypothetical protein GCM10008013_06100 [Paenibacillus segetis]
MVPVRLVLAVQDEQYIELFLHYVQCSEFQQRLVVTAFSRRDAFLRYIEDSRELIHVVLGESYFMEYKSSECENQIPWICLGEGEMEQQYVGRVSKYQSLHAMLSIVLGLYRGRGEGAVSSEGKCQVIGVYSALGGSGKTTVALNIAKQLGMQGNRTFYLNLETVNAGIPGQGQIQNGGQRAGLARLLYDLKGDDLGKSPISPVSTYAFRHPALQSDIFSPVDNIKEILEMEEKDTRQLIDYIVDSELYDAVIVDIDSAPNHRSFVALERSDKLVWVLLDEWSGMQKTDLWMSYLERSYSALYSSIMGKTFFVVNRYSGEMSVPLPKRGMAVEATLSYISTSNQGMHGALLHSPLFQRDILRLCREVYTEKSLVARGGLVDDKRYVYTTAGRDPLWS